MCHTVILTGDLLECTICPRVYHLKCAGLKAVPKGVWYCPWHECAECGRRSSTAGGKLFRCMRCPTA
jgi:SWI/SNF-related matrix-associated actin-dependent regulator of chromatin subfamily A member 5